MNRQSERDQYGIERKDAEVRLTTFLHDTLREPQAKVADLHLEDGRWQGRVQGSQRGISVVFLVEHNAEVVPGHMTVDAAPDTLKKR